ncbi:MAG: hypothetical protein NXI20_02800 [bacterium]|nr:hypothetical protein [bacterium]
MLLNYQEIYEETKSDLRDAEVIRRKNMPFAIVGTLIVLIAPTWLITKMALILINGTNEDIQDWLAFLIFIITVIGIGIIRYFAFRSVQLIFRGLVVPKIVEKIGQEFYYSQMGHVDEKLGDQSKIFPSHALWKGKDHVSGKVDDQLIELSKIVLRTSGSSSSSGSNSSQSTVYTGVLIHMELPFEFTDPIWIVPNKRLFSSNFPLLSEVENREVVRINGLQRGYILHTTNSVLAKRLFSGNRLTEVNNLIKKFRRKGITKKHVKFAFYDNHIVIAFKRKKGVFSLSWMPLFTKLDSPEFIEKQLLVLNAALGLRDSFA